MNIISGTIQTAQKCILYGPEGIGKSTFAAQFPDVLFIDTEGSTKRLNVRRFEQPTSWQMLLEQVRYVINNPTVCGTLAIDTADWAERLCTDSVLARYNKKGIEDFGYGKGYVYLMEEFGKLLDLLTEVIDKGVNVVITAHAKLQKFEQPDEMGSYDRWGMKLSKQTAPLVKEWADMILFANYKTIVVKDGSGENAKAKAQGGKRVMYTSHHPCWDAKNRHGLAEELPFEYGVIAHSIPSKSGAPAAPVTVVEAPRQSGSQIGGNELSVTVVPPEQSVELTKPKVTEETLSSDIPKPLRDLMITNQVEEWEIQLAVSNKGYFPRETPIANYGADFIQGALIDGWPKLFETIMNDRDLPF